MGVPGARSRTCVGQVLHARQVVRKHFFFTERTHLEMKLLSGKVASNTSKSPIIRFRVKLKSLTQIWKRSRWFGLGYFFCANDLQREVLCRKWQHFSNVNKFRDKTLLQSTSNHRERKYCKYEQLLTASKLEINYY